MESTKSTKLTVIESQRRSEKILIVLNTIKLITTEVKYKHVLIAGIFENESSNAISNAVFGNTQLKFLYLHFVIIFPLNMNHFDFQFHRSYQIKARAKFCAFYE